MMVSCTKESQCCLSKLAVPNGDQLGVDVDIPTLIVAPQYELVISDRTPGSRGYLRKPRMFQAGQALPLSLRFHLDAMCIIRSCKR
jgi:hypothetical protein